MNRILSSISKKIKTTSETIEKGVFTMFKNQQSDQKEIEYLKPQKFQKVECYSIHDASNKTINKDYKILKDEEFNKLINLNSIQMTKISMYLTESFQEYKRREIYISNEDLIKYHTIYEFVSNELKNKEISDPIRKDLVDFIVRDMQKSYLRKGFKGKDFAKKEFKFYDEDMDN